MVFDRSQSCFQIELSVQIGQQSLAATRSPYYVPHGGTNHINELAVNTIAVSDMPHTPEVYQASKVQDFVPS